MSRWLMVVCALALACGEDEKIESIATPDPGVVSAEPGAQAAKSASPYRIEAVSGNVNIVRSEGEQAGTVGAVLATNESVRTGKGGSVTLKIDDVSIRIDEESTVTAGDVTDEAAEVNLEKGRAYADVSSGSRAVRVRSSGSSAVAETNEGAFTVYNDGRGLVAVASTRGTVKFGSPKGDSVLAAGQRGVSKADGKPEVSAVPREVLLNVNWPNARKNVEIRGQAEPGTAVRVNGSSVATGPDGAFVASLTLEPGDNAIEVSALDLSGRQRSVKRVIKVRERAPGVRANTKGIWK